MRTSNVRRWVTSMVLIGAVGCGADANVDEPVHSNGEASETDGEQVEGRSGGTRLLAVASRGGRTLEFRGNEAGDIIEIEYGKLDEVELPTDATDKDDFVARYELLSGSKAPPELRDAQARLEHQRTESDDDGPQTSPALPSSAVQKDVGRAWPKPASRGWFRTNYCTATDRTWFGLDMRDPEQRLHWSGVNYWRAGVFNAHPTDIIGVGLEYTWAFGGETMRRDLPPGHYMALRVSTSANATAFVGVGANFPDFSNNYQFFNDYDICVNYHF